MKSKGLLYILFFFPYVVFGQDMTKETHGWQLTSLEGAAKLESLYRNRQTTTNNIFEKQKSSLFWGGLQLNTTSYIWHPNFISLNIGGEYSPEKRKELYLVIPDQSEAVTAKKVDISALFFKQKQINLGVFANYNESYNARENLSNIKTKGLSAGANFLFTNKIVPISASFHQSKWNETEIQTARSFTNTQKNFEAAINKTFSSYDNTELVYSHDDFDRLDAGIYHLNNISDYVTLNNTLAFDKDRNYFTNTNASVFNQKGNDTLKRLQVNEIVSFRPIPQINITGSYNLIDNKRPDQDMTQQSLMGAIRHSLYKSLNTSVSYEYNTMDQTNIHESYAKAGVDILYEKLLPAKGKLTLGYTYFNQNQRKTSDSQVIQIMNEDHRLKDGEIMLLYRPYAERSSILVKDITGTIIYQPGFDYILIDRTTYIEIQRMPGGQIANDSHVFVDYLATQPGSYQYNAVFNQFSARLMFFNRLIEVYYRNARQDYSNLESADYLTLNYFKQNLLGAQVEYKFFTGGIEYDNYSSSIIPYKLARYFIQMQGVVKNKFLYSINGNIRDYKIIDTEKNQQYADLSGNIAYMLTSLSKLNFELGYRKQSGNKIDLDLLTFRTEFTTTYRKLFLKVGVEIYRRTYLNEDVNFNGAYFQIVRNFSWSKK